MITTDEVIRRFTEVIARVDPRLHLDRGAVRYVQEPFAGVEFGLRLGEASALLFMPEADLTADDWPERLARRFDAARRYLENFPGAGSPSGRS